MRNKLSILLFFLLILTSFQVFAGKSQYIWLSVDPTNRVASGQVGSIRGTTNIYESISCRVVSGPNVVLCEAITSLNNQFSCQAPYTTNLGLAVSAIKSSSYIYFKWDANKVCTDLIVINSSMYPHMVP